MINLDFIINNAKLKSGTEDILSIIETGSHRYLHKNSSDVDYIVIIKDNSSLINKNFQIYSDLLNNNDYIIYAKSLLNKILFDNNFYHINKQYLLLDFAKGYVEDGYLLYGSKIFEYDLKNNKDFVKKYFEESFVKYGFNIIIKTGLNNSKRLYQAFNFMYLYKNNFEKLNAEQTKVLEIKNQCLKLPLNVKIDFYNFYNCDVNFVYEYEYYEESLKVDENNSINYQLKNEKEVLLKNTMRQKKKFLLDNFQKYLKKVKYGLIRETPEQHQENIDWYQEIKNNSLKALSYPPKVLL